MLKRLAFLCLLPLAALAQAADEVSTKPGVLVATSARSPLDVVLSILQSPVGALVVAAVVAGIAGRHLLKAWADRLVSDAAAAHHGAAVAAGERVAAHLLTSLDSYLEQSSSDVVTVLTDPAKRAVAAQTLRERARSELPGAVQQATEGLGSSFLDGAVSAALDAAHLKALQLPAVPA